MSWETTDVLSADTTDVLSADTTDVLSADTTDVLSADTTQCWSPGIGPQDVSVCVCKALATPEAKKVRPLEIIIPTKPKLTEK